MNHDLINPALDLASIRQELEREGLVRIDGYLPQDYAGKVLACLEREVHWDMAYSEAGKGRLIKAGKLASMDPQEVRKQVNPAFDFACSPFQFIYNTFKPVESWQAGEYSQHFLYDMANAMHQSDHLDHIRQMTGCPSVNRMDLIAARYLPGHFLTLHDDESAAEGREMTYILNLTKDWQAEWGGLLHLLDKERQSITHSFVPRFNSMILFRPPRWHFVSQVANFARLPRYTLTGWMLNT